MIYSPDQAEVVPTSTNNTVYITNANDSASYQMRVRTDTSAQINLRSLGTPSMSVTSHGWVDTRR